MRLPRFAIEHHQFTSVVILLLVLSIHTALAVVSLAYLIGFTDQFDLGTRPQGEQYVVGGWLAYWLSRRRPRAAGLLVLHLSLPKRA